MSTEPYNAISVSIIIPTYNRETILSEVLPTYLRQEHVREVIIVNDGSTDNTARRMDQWQRENNSIQCMHHPQRSGQQQAKNSGVARACGELIFFGEDDVFLEDSTLPVLLRCMADQDADIVGCRNMYMHKGETTHDTMQRYDSLCDPVFDPAAFRFNFGCRSDTALRVPFLQAIVLIKKELFSRITFDDRYWGSAFREETDFFIRCAQAGYKLLYCPDARAFNLPRPPGGAHARSPWVYEISAILNNWRFLRTHYDYLYEVWGLRIPRLTLQMRFTRERLRILFSKLTAPGRM
jgi:glycosyltransferase involved in cell wall biosynthesis